VVLVLQQRMQQQVMSSCLVYAIG